MAFELEDNSARDIPSKERNVLENVAHYLSENYDCSSIHLTGSAIHSANPDDYDIVVERESDEFDNQEDYKVVAEMVNKMEKGGEETTNAQNWGNYLQRELGVRVWNHKIDSDITRVEMSIEEVDIDLSFSPNPPYDESKLILV